MTRTVSVAVMSLALCMSMTQVDAETINGKVVDASGKAMEGVTVSAFDEERQQSISVFSQADGSFAIGRCLTSARKKTVRRWRNY